MSSVIARLTLFQEPTLLPKVRIQFADFPYLHYSNRPKAANLGDLMRNRIRLSSQPPQKRGTFEAIFTKSE